MLSHSCQIRYQNVLSATVLLFSREIYVKLMKTWENFAFSHSLNNTNYTIQYSLFKEGDVITQWVIKLTAFTTIQNTHTKTMPNQ